MKALFCYVLGFPNKPLLPTLGTLTNDETITSHNSGGTHPTVPHIVVWGDDNMIINVDTDTDPLYILADSRVPRMAVHNPYGKLIIIIIIRDNN